MERDRKNRGKGLERKRGHTGRVMAELDEVLRRKQQKEIRNKKGWTNWESRHG